MPIELPGKHPVSALTMILNTEAATVFDKLTRRGVSEGMGRWPSSLRQGEFVLDPGQSATIPPHSEHRRAAG